MGNDQFTSAYIILLLNPNVGQYEMTCDVEASFFGSPYAFQFEVLSAQPWIYFDFCTKSVGNHGCWREYELEKWNEDEARWQYIDDCFHKFNECIGCTFSTNFSIGRYQVSGPGYTYNGCNLGTYNGSVFMGCNTESASGIADATKYIPFTDTEWPDDVISKSKSDDIISDISCDIIIQGEKGYKQYYGFTILNTTDWISFDTCDETQFTPELITYKFDGRYVVSRSTFGSDSGSSCQTQNLSTVLPGHYYLGIGYEHGWHSHDDGDQYTIQMKCSNNAHVAVATGYNEWNHGLDDLEIIIICISAVCCALCACMGVCIFRKQKCVRINKSKINRENDSDEYNVTQTNGDDIEMVQYVDVKASAPPQEQISMDNNDGHTTKHGENKNDNENLDALEGIVDNEVTYWINNTVKLPGYGYDALLIENGFDRLDIIRNQIEMQDLIDIGIDKLGHRKSIISQKKKLQRI
eukprot:164982_1